MRPTVRGSCWYLAWTSLDQSFSKGTAWRASHSSRDFYFCPRRPLAISRADCNPDMAHGAEADSISVAALLVAACLGLWVCPSSEKRTRMLPTPQYIQDTTTSVIPSGPCNPSTRSSTVCTVGTFEVDTNVTTDPHSIRYFHSASASAIGFFATTTRVLLAIESGLVSLAQHMMVQDREVQTSRCLSLIDTTNKAYRH